MGRLPGVYPPTSGFLELPTSFLYRVHLSSFQFAAHFPVFRESRVSWSRSVTPRRRLIRPVLHGCTWVCAKISTSFTTHCQPVPTPTMGIGMHVMAVHMTPNGACSARSCKSSTTSFGWRCTSYLSTAGLSPPQCHHVACLSSGSEPHAIGATGDRAITRCKHSALTQIDSGVCGSVCELESYEAPYGGTVIASLSSGHLSLTP